MKKGRGWNVVVFALAAFAILAGAIAVKIELREREIAMHSPPSLDDLAELSTRLGPTVQGLAEPTDSTEAPLDEPAPQQPTALPSRLERPVSPDERPTTNDALEARWIATVCKICEGVFSFVSEKEAAGWAWERGQELTRLGEWDAARRCYWVALDAPLEPNIIRFACAELAWLEDDPEKALRYLELSCQGDSHGTWLPNAVDLCRTTGSNALADHYLARMRRENPEMARLFDMESSR